MNHEAQIDEYYSVNRNSLYTRTDVVKGTEEMFVHRH